MGLAVHFGRNVFGRIEMLFVCDLQSLFSLCVHGNSGIPGLSATFNRFGNAEWLVLSAFSRCQRLQMPHRVLLGSVRANDERYNRFYR